LRLWHFNGNFEFFRCHCCVDPVIAFQRTGETKDMKNNKAELLAKVKRKMRQKEASEVEKKT
jgi:hypothetical protein